MPGRATIGGCLLVGAFVPHTDENNVGPALVCSLSRLSVACGKSGWLATLDSCGPLALTSQIPHLYFWHL
jgi:hypothetical protein